MAKYLSIYLSIYLSFFLSFYIYIIKKTYIYIYIHIYIYIYTYIYDKIRYLYKFGVYVYIYIYTTASTQPLPFFDSFQHYLKSKKQGCTVKQCTAHSHSQQGLNTSLGSNTIRSHIQRSLPPPFLCPNIAQPFHKNLAHISEREHLLKEGGAIVSQEPLPLGKESNAT